MALVRLRSRPRRVPGDGWVTARGAGRWTRVGNLDSPNHAVVDPGGLVAVAGRTWSLDWWIGAEDRWHVPAREVAVRQVLIGASPVVETRVRVPSGDAVQRTYAARGPNGEDALVVEVHNDTKVPFALALAVRPYGVDGDGHAREVELDGTTVRVDGLDALVLPRSPGRIALSTAVGGDAAAVVFAGAAEPVHAAHVRCPDGLATAALLFPLAHTASVRVVLPLATSPTAGAEFDPGRLPSAEQVAAGWATHTRRGARFEVPSRALRDAAAASSRFLLLDPSRIDAIAALDLLGFADEAAAGLVADPTALARAARPGAVLQAVAQHWELTRDGDVARDLVALIGALVARLPRTSPDDAAAGRAALPAIAHLLDAVDEPVAAADLRTLVTAPSVPDPPARSLDDLLGSASPTWTWPAGHDVAGSAALVTELRRTLVRELPDGLALCPDVPEAWLGQGWEVHDVPTARGRLSYAIRWHGERPALLWDLEPHPGGEATTITAPGLDPAWSTTDARGEVLLAPVAVPERPRERRGLTIPVTIEPMPRRST